MAFFDALAEVEKEDAEVPNHLRDASRDAEGFGHGDGYIYPHAYRNHWAAQQYLPTTLRGKTFYSPSVVGYEGKIREEVLKKREIQSAVILGDGGGANRDAAANAAEGEYLSWSASSKGREGWFKRLESGRSALLLSDRDAILAQASIARHDRVLIPVANDGLLLWESLRRVPEGLCAATVDSEAARDALLRLAVALDKPEQPQIAVISDNRIPAPEEAERLFDSPAFDHIFAREPWKRGFGAGVLAEAAFSLWAQKSSSLLAQDGDVVILQSPPALGERISRIVACECGAARALAEKLTEAETAFFSGAASGWWAWDRQTLETSFRREGFETAVTVLDQSEERLLTERDIAGWFDAGRWAAQISQSAGEDDFAKIRAMLTERAKQGPLVWKWRSLLLTARKKRAPLPE
jgi:putative ATPase